MFSERKRRKFTCSGKNHRFFFVSTLCIDTFTTFVVFLTTAPGIRSIDHMATNESAWVNNKKLFLVSS